MGPRQTETGPSWDQIKSQDL